jgi:hypothetical protein
MKRTLLTLMAGAAVLSGFMVVQRASNERARPHRIKETFWSKLRELWAIRRRCQELKLQQRGNQLQNRRTNSSCILYPPPAPSRTRQT